MPNLNQAIIAASNCSGMNAPDLRIINEDNVIQMRKEFLENVAYNGKMTHEDIIIVLQYMSPYCK